MIYRKPRKPFIVGELRVRSWKTLEANIAQDDARWRVRCAQYWNLQGALYGVQFSNFSMMVDNNGGFVSTAATVMEILPGERTDDSSRVRVGDTGVGSVK